MQVTSLEMLKQMKLTEIIELTPFNDGTPLIIEAKRPNLMNLISSGKIPNPLMNSAMKIFKSGVGVVANEAMDDVKALKDLSGLMEILAEHTLISPSYNDLKENGIELTDMQLIEIMNYMQGGVDVLVSFRKKQECNENNKSIDEVQEVAERDIEN